MPRFVAVYTMKPEDLAAFRAHPKSEQEAIDKAGLKAWEEWRKRNAAAIVATDVMVGKTRRVTKTGIVDARNQIRRLSDRRSRRHHHGRRPLPGSPAHHRLPRRRYRRHARRHGTARG